MLQDIFDTLYDVAATYYIHKLGINDCMVFKLKISLPRFSWMNYSKGVCSLCKINQLVNGKLTLNLLVMPGGRTIHYAEVTSLAICDKT